jgi:hypothetical protein
MMYAHPSSVCSCSGPSFWTVYQHGCTVFARCSQPLIHKAHLQRHGTCMCVDQATKHYTYHSMATLMISTITAKPGQDGERERERERESFIRNYPYRDCFHRDTDMDVLNDFPPKKILNIFLKNIFLKNTGLFPQRYRYGYLE